MLGSLPLVSVIMPCYNAEQYIANAIESVLNQKYSDIELIIVDDGSTDNTLSVCRKLQGENKSDKKILIEKQQNKGPYPARNLGLSKASGRYIAFLDADDYWSEDCIQELYKAIEQNNVDVAYCGWQNVGDGGPGSTEPYIPPEYEKSDVVKAFLKSCPWPIHAALVKREIIDGLNGFSERYFTSLDFDLWLRLTELTKKIKRVPKVLAFYRWHDSGQISSIKSRQVIDAWNVRKDYTKKNVSLVGHLSKEELNELVNDALLKQAYIAYWRRDINSSSILFRKAFFSGYWEIKDLRFIVLAFIPVKLFQAVLHIFNKF